MRRGEGGKKLLDGLWLRRARPELFDRPCARCRVWVYDESGLAREDDGSPIPRPRPVDCDPCLKRRLGFDGWSPANRKTYWRIMTARRRGGPSESEERDVNFLYDYLRVCELEERLDAENQAERSAEIVLRALASARR